MGRHQSSSRDSKAPTHYKGTINVSKYTLWAATPWLLWRKSLSRLPDTVCLLLTQLDLSDTINLVYTPTGTMATHPTLTQQSGTMYPNTTSFFPFAFYIEDPEAKYHLKIIPHTLIHVVSDYEHFCGSADKYPLKTKPWPCARLHSHVLSTYCNRACAVCQVCAG